jgi:hypothetical protein
MYTLTLFALRFGSHSVKDRIFSTRNILGKLLRKTLIDTKTKFETNVKGDSLDKIKTSFYVARTSGCQSVH